MRRKRNKPEEGIVRSRPIACPMCGTPCTIVGLRPKDGEETTLHYEPIKELPPKKARGKKEG